MSKTLVTAKINPDLDGTSCTLAYTDLLYQLGKDAEGYITGSTQSEVKYFVEKHNIKIPTRTDNRSNKWNNFVLVDSSSMKGMPKVVISDKVIEIIDHRTGEPEKEFPNARIQNELIGAAATIVVERFIKTDKNIKPDHAKLLYGAIYHNTLNLIATNTNQRDRDAAKYLEEKYGLEKNLIQEMFDISTNEVLADVKTSLEADAKEFEIFNRIYGAYQLVVWNNNIFKQRSFIEKTMDKINSTLNNSWYFLNIIELNNKKSHIYANPEGENILSKALGVSFKKGWCILPAILRKQIIPRINDVLK